jgi:hypothetical protein
LAEVSDLNDASHNVVTVVVMLTHDEVRRPNFGLPNLNQREEEIVRSSRLIGPESAAMSAKACKFHFIKINLRRIKERRFGPQLASRSSGPGTIRDQGHNDGGSLMKKLLIGTAVLFTALPFSFDGVTPTVSKAHAVIGRPLTPFSVAGVHRRAVRRTFGVGANLGYRGVYHRNFGPYAYGTGWGGGWGGWNRPLYSSAGWGGGWGGWGWNRPLYSSVGWGGGWGGWGWNRPWRRGWW